MELPEILSNIPPIVLYLIAFILLVIIVAVVSLLVGKRKYNKANGKTPEKKVKTAKPKSGKKLRKTDPPIHISEEYNNGNINENAAQNSSFRDELDSDEDYDNAVASLKSASTEKTSQTVVSGPVIVVDEKKINEEQIIEWKPPTEEKKEIKSENVAAAAAVTAAASAETKDETPIIVAPVPAPSENDWNDDDLELFEARAYSFDEETQSGYVAGNAAPNAEETKEAEVDETIYAFRERKSTRDPSEDEGVQFLETVEEKPEKVSEPVAKERKTNSKYAYFDAVMEKEKSSPAEDWKPPEKKEPAPAAEPPTEKKPKKSGMQYIELDLDEK
jgi:hypothetical protein